MYPVKFQIKPNQVFAMPITDNSSELAHEAQAENMFLI